MGLEGTAGLGRAAAPESTQRYKRRRSYSKNGSFRQKIRQNDDLCHNRRDNMATLKPITPLQPLMQASMKPPAPLLAPKQRPLKPASPLHPKTAPKTPISHPQRRWRFQPHARTSEQRRWRFQLGLGLREQRRRRFHARNLLCPRAMAGPGCGTRVRWRGLAGRPVGGRRYKRRQTNAIQIASRGPL